MQDSYLHFIIHNLKGMILTCNQTNPRNKGHKVDQESEFKRKDYNREEIHLIIKVRFLVNLFFHIFAQKLLSGII